MAKLKILLNDMKKKNVQVYFTGLNDSLKIKFIKQNIIKESSIFNTIDETINTCNEILYK